MEVRLPWITVWKMVMQPLMFDHLLLSAKGPVSLIMLLQLSTPPRTCTCVLMCVVPLLWGLSQLLVVAFWLCLWCGATFYCRLAAQFRCVELGLFGCQC